MNEKERKEYLDNMEDLEKYYAEMYVNYKEPIDLVKNDKEIEEGEEYID